MRDIPVYIQKPMQAMSGKVDYEVMLQLSTIALKKHPEDRECLIGWHTSFLFCAKHLEECVAFVNEMAPTMKDDDYRQDGREYVLF